jgi:Ni,Fe-hydrogenase I small subunit
MAQSTILASAQTAATSSDVVIAAGASAVVGIFAAAGVQIPEGVRCTVLQDTPGNDNAIKFLTAQEPTTVINGPGTFRVWRPAITAYGVNVGAFSEA